MIFLARIFVFIFVLIILFLSGFFVLLVTHRLDIDFILQSIYVIYHDDQLRLIVGIVTGVLIGETIVFYRLFLNHVQRNKVIAFDNPAGRVAVSLLAMEEMVKREIRQMPEIKDVKVVIRASRKGLDVDIRLIIVADLNIPQLTSRVQGLVTRKIQEIIGIEGRLKIHIYVGKILKNFLNKSTANNADKYEQPNIPFQGYRA
ncbi:MAG: alkaline shock response membrane anchor protein AmaP [Candidatus Omnitrophota bacterium]|nr:alkaline shock response membrane anchor protein AmaP [Candidatus Omnitrophota bacterium]